MKSVYRKLGRYAPGMLQVSHDAGGILFLRVLWAGLGFLSNLLVARLYGAAWAGTFFLGVAIVTVCATIAQLGMHLPLMRMVAVATEGRDGSAVRALLRKASLLAFTTGAAFTIFILATAEFAGRILSDASLPMMLRIMGLAIVPYSLVLLIAAGFMSIGRPALAELNHRIGFQLGFIALIVILVGREDGLVLGISFSITYWLLLILGRWQWSRATRSEASPSSIPSAALLRPAIPILFASTIQLVITYSDTLMIGFFMSSDSVGVYGTAIRVSTTMALVLGAAASVFGPRFAALHQRGDSAELENLARRVARGCGLVALPLLAVFLIFPKPVMSLFGPEFVSGSTALMILAVGQFVNVASGLVGLLLAMTGHEKRLLQATAVSALLNILLNLILIPRLGIEGAAVATAASLILINVLYAYLVRRELGMSVVGIGRSQAAA
jgi:O-antigen/teichoic acid export membrane protein